jgi:hypothetical protein
LQQTATKATNFNKMHHTHSACALFSTVAKDVDVVDMTDGMDLAAGAFDEDSDADAMADVHEVRAIDIPRLIIILLVHAPC